MANTNLSKLLANIGIKNNNNVQSNNNQVQTTNNKTIFDDSKTTSNNNKLLFNNSNNGQISNVSSNIKIQQNLSGLMKGLTKNVSDNPAPKNTNNTTTTNNTQNKTTTTNNNQTSTKLNNLQGLLKNTNTNNNTNNTTTSNTNIKKTTQNTPQPQTTTTNNNQSTTKLNNLQGLLKNTGTNNPPNLNASNTTNVNNLLKNATQNSNQLTKNPLQNLKLNTLGNTTSTTKLTGATTEIKTGGTTTTNTKEIDNLKKEISDKLNSLKGSHFYEKNGASIEKVINNPNVTKTQLQEVKKKFPELNNIIEVNEQGYFGDCWLLSAINTKLGKSVSDIVHINKDGSCTVTFKPCTITTEDKYGNHQINVTSDPIKVSSSELQSTYYGRYNQFKLSLGDEDTKAIEIAYLKLMENNGLDLNSLVDANTRSEGLKLLYGKSDTCSYLNKTREVLSDEKIELYEILGFLDISFDFTDLEKLMSNCVAMTAGLYIDNLTSSEYSNYLKNSQKLLIKAGYNENEVNKAISTLKTRGYNSVSVPSKSGKNVSISFDHAYTVKSIKNGYVELINPWNNQESFEITELYFKLMCDIQYVEK